MTTIYWVNPLQTMIITTLNEANISRRVIIYITSRAKKELTNSGKKYNISPYIA